MFVENFAHVPVVVGTKRKPQFTFLR